MHGEGLRTVPQPNQPRRSKASSRLQVQEGSAQHAPLQRHPQIFERENRQKLLSVRGIILLTTGTSILKDETLYHRSRARGISGVKCAAVRFCNCPSKVLTGSMGRCAQTQFEALKFWSRALDAPGGLLTRREGGWLPAISSQHPPGEARRRTRRVGASALSLSIWCLRPVAPPSCCERLPSRARFVFSVRGAGGQAGCNENQEARIGGEGCAVAW